MDSAPNTGLPPTAFNRASFGGPGGASAAALAEGAWFVSTPATAEAVLICNMERRSIAFPVADPDR